MGRALIAEDAEPVRRLLQILLEREGLQVDTAKSGREALDHLTSRKFDLILLDLMLPEISGYQVLSHLSEHQPDALRKLILITAASEKELGLLLSAEPGLAVIRKPFDIRQVSALVRQRLGTEPPAELEAHEAAEHRGEEPGGEPALFELHCMACDSVSGFEAGSERQAWERAREAGWHVVVFLKEDSASRKPKRQLITFCPVCASQGN